MRRIKNLKLKIKNSGRGFTLIEMVITIGILGVLAVTAIAVLNPAAQFQKANDAKRKTDLSQIQKALESYYQDAQRYPPGTGYITANNVNNYLINTDVYSLSCPTAPATACKIDWGSAWQPYMNVVPADPAAPAKRYVYSVSADGQTYYLYASLDKGTTADFCKTGVTGSLCGTTECGISTTCNYGVSSPNATP